MTNHSLSFPGAKTLTCLSIALMLAACGGGGSSDSSTTQPDNPGGNTGNNGGGSSTEPVSRTLTLQIQGLPEGITLPVTYGSANANLTSSSASLAIENANNTQITLGNLKLTTEQPYLVNCAFSEPLAGTLQANGSLLASLTSDTSQVVECNQKITAVVQQRLVSVLPSTAGSGLNVLTAKLDGSQAQWLNPALMVHNTTTNSVSALVDNELYISAKDDDVNSATGWELRATNGTITRLVKDIHTTVTAGVGTGSIPSNLVALGSKLYFTANDGSGGSLWVSNGSETGTQKVLFNGSAFNGAENLTIAGDKLFFKSQNKVYAIDNNGTVTDLGLNQTAGSFYVVGSRIYLQDANQKQWFSDGTAAGTTEFNAAWFNNTPIEFNGELYFSGAATNNETAKLYAINPNGTNLRLVKDIMRVSLHAVLDGKLLFTVNDRGVTGSEWWVSDGTEAGTQIVKDAIPGPSGLNPQNVFVLSDRLVFMTAEGVTSGQAPYYLWSTDGTANGTKRLSTAGVDAFLTKNISIGWQQAGSNRAIFQIHEGSSTSNIAKLWVTDGTPEGTKPLLDKSGQQLEAYSTGSQYAL
ncbi:hypothetical protein [Lampropedia hyalina]|nr:hypothetical protein [Lampropedia hyalina]